MISRGSSDVPRSPRGSASKENDPGLQPRAKPKGSADKPAWGLVGWGWDKSPLTLCLKSIVSSIPP